MLTDDKAGGRYPAHIADPKSGTLPINTDLIGCRKFDFSRKFLPDSMSMVGRFDFLSGEEQRFFSQIQGRTYINMFDLFGRLTQHRPAGAASCDVRRCAQLFYQVNSLIQTGMPLGYRFVADDGAVSLTVPEKSRWSVLALVFLMDVSAQLHYQKSIEPDYTLSPLFKDVFHTRRSTAAQCDAASEIDWVREDTKLSAGDRSRAVDDFIELLSLLEKIICKQAVYDAGYLLVNRSKSTTKAEMVKISQGIKTAYRWQYIFFGLKQPRFTRLFQSMVSGEQESRMEKAVNAMG